MLLIIRKVFLFTSLLFLSGYVLQQQTVQSIQAAIKPPPPIPTPSVDASQFIAKSFGTPSRHLSADKFLASNRPKRGWAKVAYAQLVRNHLHVCNTIMLFAELERQESLARRVILYPQEWHIPESNLETPSAHIETSLRLLRTAQSRYKVELQPVNQIQGSRNGTRSEGTEGPKEYTEALADRLRTEAEAYPLASLLSLTMFDRLIYLQPSGLIINSGRLDVLFTLSMESETKGVFAKLHEEKQTPPVLIFEPSTEALNKSMAVIEAGNYREDEFLRSIPSSNAAASNRSDSVVETSAMYLEDDGFNLSSFIDKTSYVHISDPGMLGPEFGSPRSRMIRARPEQTEPREVWEAVYERFRQQRMEVCGLDLEPDPELIEANRASSRLKKLRIQDENEKTLRIQNEAG